jgi:hypothetical protein
MFRTDPQGHQFWDMTLNGLEVFSPKTLGLDLLYATLSLIYAIVLSDRSSENVSQGSFGIEH